MFLWWSLFLGPWIDTNKALQNEIAAIVSIIFYLFFVCIFIFFSMYLPDPEEVADT